MSSAEDVAMADAGGATAPRLSLRVFGSIAVGLALLSATVTFLVLAGLTPIAPTHQVVVSVLAVDLCAALLLVAVIGREVWNIIRRVGADGRARACMCASSACSRSWRRCRPCWSRSLRRVTLDRGLAPWFSSRIQIGDPEFADRRAGLFQRAARRCIRSEITAMAFDVSRAKPLFDSDRERFRQFLSGQARVRGLPLTLMVHSDLSVVEKAEIEGVGDIAPPSANGRAGRRSTRPSRRSRCSSKPRASRR